MVPVHHITRICMALNPVSLVIYTLGFYRIYCNPTPGTKVSADRGTTSNIDSKSITFLLDKGYLDSKLSRSMGSVQDQKPLSAALKRFQKFLGIPQSGLLDAVTKDYMRRPRCGMADMSNDERRKRKKRYNHQGSKWRNTKLTWALETSNNDGLSDYQVRRVLSVAFRKWSSVTNLQFRELVGHPDNSAQIRVRFVRRAHGDPYAFDGAGGTLAHAFYPLNNLDLAGDVHFDDDEVFSIHGIGDTTSRRQKKLLWVAVHEIGHSIGLEHSSVQGAIMWPYYQHFEGPDFDLTYDDILGIQLLYGGKVKPPNPPPNTTPKPNPRTILPIVPTVPIKTTSTKVKCPDSMTGPFVGIDGRLYFFNSNKLYMSYEKPRPGIEAGPLPISTYFRGVTKVDAVFTHPYYRSHVVFHGNTFHTFEENKVKHGGVRKIKHGFQGVYNENLLHNIDAAVAWPETGQLYLFKNESYWRFRRIPRTRDYILDRGYPQNIAKKWRGLPASVDSVFAWNNGKVYFTKSDLYYRWDERKNQVQSGYPVRLRRSFLKC